MEPNGDSWLIVTTLVENPQYLALPSQTSTQAGRHVGMGPHYLHVAIRGPRELPEDALSDSWLIVTTLVENPQYLARPFQTSMHLKKQADPSGWGPTPCTSR